LIFNLLNLFIDLIESFLCHIDSIYMLFKLSREILRKIKGSISDITGGDHPLDAAPLPVSDPGFLPWQQGDYSQPPVSGAGP
jgi:hypothetical protein